MNHYQTTTDKVLGLILPESKEELVMDGIVIPANVRKASLDKNPLAEMLVHSVGPDCKTVRAGDRALYNRHHISPIPCEEGELIVLPEGQVVAVVKVVEEKKPEPSAVPPPPAEPLTVGAIRAALEAKPGLPAEAPPVIAVVQ